jgi:hypothetical protein
MAQSLSSSIHGYLPTLSRVVKGYLDALVFADVQGGQHPRLTKQARAAASRDCLAFISAIQGAYYSAINQKGYSPYQFGADFWYTRQGHGVGFWSRQELKIDDLGEYLSAHCGYGTQWPPVDVEIARGWIYL